MNAPRTARDRAHAELKREILCAARTQLSEVGPAALSLRAVARELDMVSSAIYRYFRSRDALLTELISSTYDAIGTHAETVDAQAAKTAATPARRWVTVSTATRQWALQHPHEFALVYGTPVPGYTAPDETAIPAGRLPLALAKIVSEAQATQDLRPTTAPSVDTELFHPDTLALIPSNLDNAMVALLILKWSDLVGLISFELFGHLFNVVTDYEAHFAHAAEVAAAELGLE